MMRLFVEQAQQEDSAAQAACTQQAERVLKLQTEITALEDT